MSNLLYTEASLNGKPYKKGDWREIAVHDENNIKGFFAEYSFLSNFEPCTVLYGGYAFPSSEHAYMFAKLDPVTTESSFLKEQYVKICAMKPSEVKKWGQTIKLREDWEQVKLPIMLEIVKMKFLCNEPLKVKLLATGNKYLEETGWWGDVVWGVDIQKGGQNNLGKILMHVRETI